MSIPPFFHKPVGMRIFHFSVLAVGYVLALSYLPSISVGLSTHSYFTETYLGSIAASIVLNART